MISVTKDKFEESGLETLRTSDSLAYLNKYKRNTINITLISLTQLRIGDFTKLHILADSMYDPILEYNKTNVPDFHTLD